MPDRELSVVQDAGEYNSSCGYCHSDQDTSCSHGMFAKQLTVYDYQDLLDQGWRRSGCFLYKPDLQRTCCPQYTIRLRASEFAPSKAQRRVMMKWERYLSGELTAPITGQIGMEPAAATASAGSSGAMAPGLQGTSAVAGTAWPQTSSQHPKKKRAKQQEQQPAVAAPQQRKGTDSGQQQQQQQGHELGRMCGQLQLLLSQTVHACMAAGMIPKEDYPAPQVLVPTPMQRKRVGNSVAFTSPVAFALASTIKRSAAKMATAPTSSSLSPPSRAPGPLQVPAAGAWEADGRPVGSSGGGSGTGSAHMAVASSQNAPVVVGAQMAAAAGNNEVPATAATAAAPPDAVSAEWLARQLAAALNAMCTPQPSSCTQGNSTLQHTLPSQLTAVPDKGHINFVYSMPGSPPALDIPMLPATPMSRDKKAARSAAAPAAPAAPRNDVGNGAAAGPSSETVAGAEALKSRLESHAEATSSRGKDAALKQGCHGPSVADSTAAYPQPHRQHETYRATADKQQPGSAGNDGEPTFPQRTVQQQQQWQPQRWQQQRQLHSSNGAGAPRSLVMRMIPNRFVNQEYELYARYQMSQHNDKPEDVSKENYKHFLVSTPLKHVPRSKDPSAPPCGYGSFHQQYWLDGKLIAVGVVDVLPRCLSSKYFFWDPDYAFLAPGKFSALQEIEWVKEASMTSPNLQYYYMGFYIHSCNKMRYKAEFAPSDLLCPVTKAWVQITPVVLSALDKSKYVVLSALPRVTVKPSLVPGMAQFQAAAQQQLQQLQQGARGGQLPEVPEEEPSEAAAAAGGSMSLPGQQAAGSGTMPAQASDLLLMPIMHQLGHELPTMQWSTGDADADAIYRDDKEVEEGLQESEEVEEGGGSEQSEESERSEQSEEVAEVSYGHAGASGSCSAHPDDVIMLLHDHLIQWKDVKNYALLPRSCWGDVQQQLIAWLQLVGPTAQSLVYML